MPKWEPATTLQKALSGRLDGMEPELAPGICELYESIRTAKDHTLLKRYSAVCDRALPALILNPRWMPALVECHLTPVDLRMPGVSEYTLLDGILNLIRYPLAATDKLLLLEYVLAGDQLWRRGFHK